MIVKTFMGPEELIEHIDPRFIEGQNDSTETVYAREDVIRLAKAYGKEMARQVLWEADGGLEQNGPGYVPQVKFNEVLSFINEQ